jgi:hypothetical protein
MQSNNEETEMKTTKLAKKLYEVRYYKDAVSYSKHVGFKMKLLPRIRALKIVKFLKNRGIDAFAAPLGL